MAIENQVEGESPEEGAPKPNPAGTVGTASARNRAAVLAAMESEIEAKPDVKAEKPRLETRPAAKPAPEPDDEVDEPEPNDDDDEPAELEPEPDEDPKVQKGLDRIKAAEKRMRLDLQKERATFDDERKQHKEALARIDQFGDMSRRVKYDPVSVLKALGVSDEDLVDVSKMVYASSPEFAKDPKNREAVAKLSKEREETDSLKQLRDEQKKLREEIDQEKSRAAAEKAITGFVDQVVKHVSDETPIVKQLHAKAPERARDDLLHVADVMADQLGHAPDHRDVVAMLEQVMRLEYEEAGIDAPAAKAKTKPAEPDKKPEPKPAAPAAAKSGKSDPRARRSELLQRIESGDLE